MLAHCSKPPRVEGPAWLAQGVTSYLLMRTAWALRCRLPGNSSKPVLAGIGKKPALAHVFKTLCKQRRLGACNSGLL